MDSPSDNDAVMTDNNNDVNLPSLSSFPYNNLQQAETYIQNLQQEDEEEEEEEKDNANWVTFVCPITEISNKLKREEKYTSQVFTTPTTNFPWRLGVHFAGFGQGNPNYISCFLEMGDVKPATTSSGSKLFTSPTLPPIRRAKFTIDIQDVYGSTLAEKLPRKASHDHFCGVVGDNAFDLRTARDYGYQRFCSKQLFKQKCVAGDDTATFVVKVLATPEMQKVENETNTPVKTRAPEFVGLENQGATCYLNSLIQTLYHLPELRRQVYAIDTALDSSEEGVVLEIQHLFADLQHADRAAASTERLTKAFGWTDSMVFIQHDVQEMLRELLDKLEKRILLGDKENTVIGRLFSSKYETFVRCQGGFTSTRMEEFFDVSLDVLGSPSVLASFDMYCKEEELNGDNQYEAPAEHGGKQDAIKGVRFCSFPPVLHLHLKRFAYNYDLDKAYKIHDRFEFTDELNLNPYVVASAENAAVDYTYKLHSVLVHSGNDQRGHYYVYIFINNKWYKFNDEHVTRVKASEAVEEAFGGVSSDTYNSPKRWRSDSSASAYMLVYIRKSMWDELMAPVDKVPVDLLQMFAVQAEKKRTQRAEQERRKHGGRVKFATLQDICSLVQLSPERKQDGNTWSVTDFCDFSLIEEVEIGDLRHISNADLYQVARQTFARKHVRLWYFLNPEYTLRARNEVHDSTAVQVKSWCKTNKLFVELSDNDDQYPLPARAAKEITLFFRKYDPASAALVPGVGKFVANTGLFHGPQLTRRKVWDMFRERVLTDEQERENEEYELFDLFDLNPAYSGECDNVTDFPCDDDQIVPDGMSECGDIFIYTRKPSANEKDVLAYFTELVYTCEVTARVLNSPTGERVQFKSMLNDKLDRGVCDLVAEKLDVCSDHVAMINPHANVPYDEPDHAFLMLLQVLPELTKSHRSDDQHYAYLPACEVTVDVMPIARQQLDSVLAFHFVVHVPEQRSSTTAATVTRDSLMLRNDKPVPVSLFLPELDFDLLVAETQAKLAPWLVGNPTRRLVLFTVQDGTPTMVNNTIELARTGALNASWKVLEQDGTVVLPDPYSYDSKWFGELVDCAVQGEVALVPLVYCSNVRTQFDRDAYDSAGIPTYCALVEGDTVGTLWRRLMSKLFITTKPNWRLCVLVERRLVYLDRIYDHTSQSVSPSPNLLDSSSTPDSQATAPAAAMMKRQNSQLPESSFDQLPLWLHAAFDQFRETRLVENLPTLLLVYPTYKSGGSSNGGGSQTSLSIRSS